MYNNKTKQQSYLIYENMTYQTILKDFSSFKKVYYDKEDLVLQ